MTININDILFETTWILDSFTRITATQETVQRLIHSGLPTDKEHFSRLKQVSIEVAGGIVYLRCEHISSTTVGALSQFIRDTGIIVDTSHLERYVNMQAEYLNDILRVVGFNKADREFRMRSEVWNKEHKI